ncbi:glycerol-3-phosphate acyltransferase [Candidatus Neomarinimicrobiota bacterium]
MEIVIRGALSLIIGYTLGSLLPAYFLARARGYDIREKGTGNPGLTNVVNIMGYPAAVGVALYDLLKAPLAIFLALTLGVSEPVAYAAGFAAFIGHLFPFYLGFRGGEGLATLVSLGFYALGRLTVLDNRFAYIFVPTLILMFIIFFSLYKTDRSAVPLALLIVPLLMNEVLLFFGVILHSIMFFIIGLFNIGHRIYKLLRATIQNMSDDERKLLLRKWLRPFAAVFPIGIFFSKPITIGVLATVLVFFSVIEVIRFFHRFNRFPLPYKKTEESRISSMVVFLFSSLLILLFFPTNIASLAILFVIFGDLLAWCIGKTVGGKGFLDKTWSGVVGCLITCTTIAVLYNTLGLITLPIGLLGAITATAMEAAPVVEDNFVMPTVSAIVMTIV